MVGQVRGPSSFASAQDPQEARPAVELKRTIDGRRVSGCERGRTHAPCCGMKLHVLPAGPIQTNAYLLTAPERGEAILIDAPGDVWADVADILTQEKCRLTELWITHGHWDHTQGGAELVRETKARVSAHAADREMIETPEIMERFMGERLNLEPIHVDRWLKPGERLKALGTRSGSTTCAGSLSRQRAFLFCFFRRGLRRGCTVRR